MRVLGACVPCICRLLIAELSELRGSKESTGVATDSSRATSGNILRRLGLKKTKDRSAVTTSELSSAIYHVHCQVSPSA